MPTHQSRSARRHISGLQRPPDTILESVLRLPGIAGGQLPQPAVTQTGSLMRRPGIAGGQIIEEPRFVAPLPVAPAPARAATTPAAVAGVPFVAPLADPEDVAAKARKRRARAAQGSILSDLGAEYLG